MVSYSEMDRSQKFKLIAAGVALLVGFLLIANSLGMFDFLFRPKAPTLTPEEIQQIQQVEQEQAAPKKGPPPARS